ncbi:D-alanine--D-alanine ligase [Thermosinus carboxydivorans Nor1]|uniref:D-alanine--D-alanine ligase n=1 Tax=Thermosinus carboxydivorans Nor1 TaxID=401526 RepID=A1HU48_9FIRM|nr:D-alanine--D-alanine ligase [Thermosinus carboxydivorans]EAX46432.1 D-alanine--D-alanine ligase [Thermosinus carboxydivorans Nor1]
MEREKIGVLMGGPSTEREVSLNTGKAILGALREKGYDAVGIDLDPPRFLEQLRENGVTFVFNAIHGKFGEDGALQGALDLLGIPYTGSGVLASALAMDKSISKRLFQAAGIPTPRAEIYTKADAKRNLVAEIMQKFPIPLVVKAAAQGSSIGVVIVEEESQVQAAVVEAFRYSDCIVVENFIKGKELTVAILGGEPLEVLPIIEIVPHSGRYDYHSKYTKGTTDYIIPARIDDNAAERVRQVAVAAFNLLGCRGVARVDIMLDDDNNPYVLEVNTIPGMTATSLVPKAAAAAGISFADLCERILLIAKEEKTSRQP